MRYMIAVALLAATLLAGAAGAVFADSENGSEAPAQDSIVTHTMEQAPH